MPNRILKESICTSENIDNLSMEEELFFYRLIVNCDDYGRADARPEILRAKCFPLRTDLIKIDDLKKWLLALTRENLITLYTVGEKHFLQLITWKKHQQIRAAKSKFPGPNDPGSKLISTDINCNQMISDDINCNQPISNVLVLDTRNTILDTRESNTEAESYSYSENQKLPPSPENDLAETNAKVEKMLGRALSTVELDKIGEWIDQYQPELIIEACSRAVLSKNTSFAYINGILKNWDTHALLTISQVLEHESKWEKQKANKGSKVGKSPPSIFNKSKKMLSYYEI